jgi:hypothetical protein
MPNPKKWKKCKHPECSKKEHGGIALFFEDYCWEHLPNEKKASYKKKIEAYLSGADLSGIDLSGANLKGAWLEFANMCEVNLFRANLEEATLTGADLRKAIISCTNLQKAQFYSANLEEAFIAQARLVDANLSEACLKNADLSQAFCENSDFTGTDLRGANLYSTSLKGVTLYGASLDGARNLSWEMIGKVGDENPGFWSLAEDLYRRLKNYFHQQGHYQDESKAYYHEKLMAKHDAFWRCFHLRKLDYLAEEQETGWFSGLLNRTRAFFRWFGLWFLHVFAGFGERWWRTALWGIGFVFLCAFLYWWGSNAGWAPLIYDVGAIETRIALVTSFWDCLYFSVVTFATLGFGDISPLFGTWTKVIAVAEVVMGYVFLGTLVTLIARKMMR